MFDIENIKRNVSRLTRQPQGVLEPESEQTALIAASEVSPNVAKIGCSIEMNGDIQGDEDVQVDGLIKGKILFPDNTVIVGREGRIQGNIRAHRIIVDGEVQGNLYAAEKIILRQSANVLGEIKAPRVSLEDGALFKGCIDMDSNLPKSKKLDETQTDTTSNLFESVSNE